MYYGYQFYVRVEHNGFRSLGSCIHSPPSIGLVCADIDSRLFSVMIVVTEIDSDSTLSSLIEALEWG